MRSYTVVVSLTALSALATGCGSEARRPAEPNAPVDAPAPALPEPPRADPVGLLKSLADVHSRFYEPFWKCALGGSPDREIQWRAKQLGNSVERHPERFALDGPCLPQVERGARAYRKLGESLPNHQPPLREDAGALIAGGEAVHRGFAALAKELPRSAERDVLKQRIKRHGDAWIGYQSAIHRRVESNRLLYQQEAAVYVEFVDCALGGREFTSFTGDPVMSAQDRVMEAFDEMCVQPGGGFLGRVIDDCAALLQSDGPSPSATTRLETVARHWAAQDHDYGSVVPLTGCLDGASQRGIHPIVESIVDAMQAYDTAQAALLRQGQ